MNFASDNWAGAHPAVAEALSECAAGISRPYQTGEADKRVENRLCELFEREVAVFFVATGTAANALAMAAVARPGGVAFCHETAHLVADECGAVEYLADGMRLFPVPGRAGRLSVPALEKAIAPYVQGSFHSGQPAAVSITQATEAGTVYALDEIEAISAACRRHGLPLHMDGARFANALVSLETTPAGMTWKRGVDLLSFGATKNGCWCAEALVVFDPSRAAQLPFLRKRAGQLFSKSGFVAAQFDAYLRDDLWLANARHANAMATMLANVLRDAGAVLPWPVEANAVFPRMKRSLAERLWAAGAHFYEWNADTTLPAGEPDTALYRFVTSFATDPAEIERLAGLLG